MLFSLTPSPFLSSLQSPLLTSNLLLHELCSTHVDERTFHEVGDSPGEEGISGSGGTIEEDALGLGNPRDSKSLGCLMGSSMTCGVRGGEEG